MCKGARRKVIILGAGGRDFHNFNVVFRDNPCYQVIAFTATQIPGIEGRRYPYPLSGPYHSSGIPIVPEDMLEELIRRNNVDEVVLAYTDLLYNDVGKVLSRALASGASFRILGPRETMIESTRPVIAVTAVRTGAGKSTVSRAVAEELDKRGYKVVVVRHPMAYGDLEKMVVQRFEKPDDLDKWYITLEEREEYEHYLRKGIVVYAGVDYGKILSEAEKEADIILWDGGNNDWPFFTPDFQITVADAMRPGHEVNSFPGEVNVRMADAVIINKAGQASKDDMDTVKNNIRKVNPKAEVIIADSEVFVEDPSMIKGKRVVVVEDSPSITHGHLPYGAGYVAALKYGASEVIDPRPYAKGTIKKIYEEYPHIGPVLPSTGYTPEQLRDLEDTLNSIDADVIVLGTPVDIGRLIKLRLPTVRVSYELRILDGPSISELVDRFLERAGLKLA